MFSEIWPLLKPFKKICLNIEKLNYDENIATVLRNGRVFPTMLVLQKLDLSEEKVLEIIDYNLSLPESIIDLQLKFLKPKPLPFFDTVVNKFKAAGYKVGGEHKPKTKLTGVEMMVRDKTVDFYASSERDDFPLS